MPDSGSFSFFQGLKSADEVFDGDSGILAA